MFLKRTDIIKWFFVFLASLAGLYFSHSIQLREDVSYMLPDETLRQDLVLFNELGLTGKVFISLEAGGDSPLSSVQKEDLLKRSAEEVGRALSKSGLFSKVFYRLPHGYQWKVLDYLWEYLPVLVSEEEIGWIEERLESKEMKEALRKDFFLLNSPSGFVLKKQVERDPLGLSRLIIERLKKAGGDKAVNISDGFFFNSDGTACLIWAESKFPLTDSVNAQRAISVIQGALSKGLQRGIKARITGPLPHTLANSRTVKADLKKLIPLATMVFMLIFLFVLRDPIGLLVPLIPFLAAPPAVVLLSLIYDGQISGISLGFGIVLLGISVDFAIHLYLERVAGKGTKGVLKPLLRPLFLATTTTLGVFAVLLFSDITAHRQMALLAIIGIMIAFLFSCLLVPSIPVKNARLSKKLSSLMTALPDCGFKHLRLAAWALFVAAGFLSMTQLNYNGSLKAFDVPDEEIRNNESWFRNTWGDMEGGLFVVATADDLEKTLQINEKVFGRLSALDNISFTNVAPLLPSRKKQDENLKRWNDFWSANLLRLAKDLEVIGAETGFSNNAFAPFLSWLKRDVRLLDPLDALNGPLNPLLSPLIRTISDGGGRAEGGMPARFMVVSILKDGDLKALDDSLSQLDGIRILSNEAWSKRVANLIEKDVERLFLMACMAIFVILFLSFKDLRAVTGAFAPVLAALSGMFLASFLSGKGINHMHVLMGIMVVGLSVDYGIFVTDFCLRGASRATFLAVCLCALSTLAGFGVLALAAHPVLHSLGATVLSGITAALPAAIWVTPIIVGKRRVRN